MLTRSKIGKTLDYNDFWVNKSSIVLTDKETINFLTELVEKQSAQISALLVRVEYLERELAIYKKGKNSGNSSMPPSTDFGKPKRNQSLREKSNKKVGGQPGHEGTTLTFSAMPDEIIIHIPSYCSGCGLDLDEVAGVALAKRQVIDVPMPVPICTEHQTFSKTCSCGCLNRGEFPENVTRTVQYGSNIETLIAYLSVRQYMPYNRIVEFFGQTMGLNISHGGVVGLLERFATKAVPMYQEIKNRIEQAGTVGTDETGVKVNGKNHWMWVWQNPRLTYILPAPSRGYQTIGQTFPNGLPNAVLVHDRWAAHFRTEAKDHQVCIAHLFRDFNYIQQVHQSDWATAFKDLLKNAIELSKKIDYNPFMQSQARDQLEKSLDELLHRALPLQHKLAIRIQKKLRAIPRYILCFLHHDNVPADNNGSERGIRNLKVKQKISGAFRSFQGASNFALIRSVIDTTIKSGQDVFVALKLIAKLQTD